MIIQKKYVRKLERHLPDSFRGHELRLGIADVGHHPALLERVGFDAPQAGDRLLPAIVGPTTRFNAEGKQKIRRDLPMETAYRLVEWHWTEWHGRDEVERSDFKDVPYQRYPRELIPPPGVELEIVADEHGRLLLLTNSLLYEDAQSVNLLHALNVCLELFGQCEVFTSSLVSVVSSPTRHLNWEVLPPGKYPWERVDQIVQPIIGRAKQGHQSAIAMRLETASSYEPEFIATGKAGFHGYIVFGYPQKHLYVLESAYYGNATYVFGDNWQTLSQLTKAEILNQELQKDRLVHLSGWANHFAKLFR